MQRLLNYCKWPVFAAAYANNEARCCVVLQAEVGTPTEEAPGCGGMQLTVDVSPCAGSRLQVVARPSLLLPAQTAVITSSICTRCHMLKDSLVRELPRLADWQRGASVATSCPAEPAVCALKLLQVQGRSEEELGAELTRALERCLLSEASGAGTHGASAAAAFTPEPYIRHRDA